MPACRLKMLACALAGAFRVGFLLPDGPQSKKFENRFKIIIRNIESARARAVGSLLDSTCVIRMSSRCHQDVIKKLFLYFFYQHLCRTPSLTGH